MTAPMTGTARADNPILNGGRYARLLQEEAAKFPQGHPAKLSLIKISADVFRGSFEPPNVAKNCDTEEEEALIQRLSPLIKGLEAGSSSVSRDGAKRVKALRDRMIKALVEAKLDCDRKLKAREQASASTRQQSEAQARPAVSAATPFAPDELQNRRFSVRARLLRSIVDNAKRTCDVKTLQSALAQIKRIIGDARTRNTSVSEKADLAKLDGFQAEIEREIERCQTARDQAARSGSGDAFDTSRFSLKFETGFRNSGSTNNAATTVLGANGIEGRGTTGSSNGLNTKVNAAFQIGRNAALNINFNSFQGAGSSTFTDPGATGYIPYVNGNPLVGLGQSGVFSQTSTAIFQKELEFELLFDVPINPFSLAGPIGSRQRNGSLLAARRSGVGFGGGQGGGGFGSGWKLGLVAGLGLKLRHTTLEENIGMNALAVAAGHHTKLQTWSTFIAPKITLGVKGRKSLGAGSLFGSLIGTIAPGVSVVDGRADQSIRVLNASVNPIRSAHGSRGNVQTSLSATVGYAFWGIRAGLTGSWSWEANRPFMRMPVNTGGARIAYRPVHSFAVQAFVKIPLP